MLARSQTAGRGSHGRAWVSIPGNLFLSVLLRPRGPAGNAISWSLAAAVAAIEALAAQVPDGSDLRLKWPNDITLRGAKLAGILIDSAATGERRLEWLVIGIGANLAGAPILADRPTASLAELGPAPEPRRVAEALLSRLSHWRGVMAMEGFAPVRAAWLARGPAPGVKLLITAPGRQSEWGYFAGLAESGALLLNVQGQIRQIAAGEVEQVTLDS